MTALSESGISVWWDDGITPRQAWDTEIEQAISAASTVVVLWSPRSVVSEWVRTEAHYGKDRGKLVPVLVEPCTIPIAFTLTQTVNLSGWHGNREDRQWRKLLTWITDLISTKPGNANLPSGLVSANATNVYRDAIGELPSGEPIYDGAFINPSTPPGTVFRDSDQMPVMRIVPQGSFLLGAAREDPDRAPYESPQRRIEIPAPYAIGVYPVLASEYLKWVGTLPPAFVAAPAPRAVGSAVSRLLLGRRRKLFSRWPHPKEFRSPTFPTTMHRSSWINSPLQCSRIIAFLLKRSGSTPAALVPARAMQAATQSTRPGRPLR